MPPATMNTRKVWLDSAERGLYEPSRASTSPQNPARPGRPSEAMAVKASRPPRMGRLRDIPPRRGISRVW